MESNSPHGRIGSTARIWLIMKEVQQEIDASDNTLTPRHDESWKGEPTTYQLYVPRNSILLNHAIAGVERQHNVSVESLLDPPAVSVVGGTPIRISGQAFHVRAFVRQLFTDANQ